MARKNWQVFLSPMTAVQIHADSLEIVQCLLLFKRDGQVCAQFSSYMGWFEEREDKPLTPGAILSIVPKGDEPPPGAAA